MGLAACGQEEDIEWARTAQEVRNLTDAHTRVVWAQDMSELTDVFAHGNELRLMGYDSDDGHGERVILPGPASFAKPMITRGGDRVVYSDVEHGTVHLVHWDGSGSRTLTEGFGLAIWLDPDDGTEWVYVGRDRSDVRGYPYERVVRLAIDHPEREEFVWDRTLVGTDSFQLSADGTRASGVFPWPDCGVADLTTHSLTRYGRGCWTSFAPDNSYLFWYFDGAHRNVVIVDDRTGNRWQVNVNNAPDMEGHEVYHPRWSNHPRFMTVTGPYKIRVGGNNIRGGGPDVEIHIGRFSDDYKKIEKWVQVTDNPHANFFPDVWINPTERPLPETVDAERKRFAVVELDDVPAWPVIHDDLLFLWEHRDAENEVVLADGRRTRSEPTPVGLARFGRHLDMDVRNGYFEARDAGAPLLNALRRNGTLTIEAVVTPAGPSDERAMIMALGERDEDLNMALLTSGRDVVLAWKGIDEPNRIYRARLGQWADPGPQHILFRIQPAHISFFINGHETASLPVEEMHFDQWTEQPLYFGGEPSGQHNWNGYIEGIAVYGRALTDEEAQRKAAAYARLLEKRTPPETITVNARLTHASQVPTPEAIEPYVRGLVANEYEVIEVLDGELKDKEILVAHWVILDGQTLDTAERRVGELYEMTIALYDDRPELEGERLSMDTDNILLRTFFDTE